jgi:hypothetical protein
MVVHVYNPSTWEAQAGGLHSLRLALVTQGHIVSTNKEEGSREGERGEKARHQWLVPVTIVTQEAEISRIQFKASQGK